MFEGFLPFLPARQAQFPTLLHLSRALPRVLEFREFDANSIPTQKGANYPMIRFVHQLSAARVTGRIVEAWYVSCGWAILAGKRLFLLSRFRASQPCSANQGYFLMRKSAVASGYPTKKQT
jgi:hypothetical protein